MRLRGLTPTKTPVYFDIKDIPMCINDSITILASKRNSPQILTRSIMRGSDDGTFYESDFVISKEKNGFIGFIVYIDGFYIWDANEDITIPLRSTDGYSFVPNTQMHRIDEINDKRGKLRFKCGKVSFGIDRIIYYKGREMFITIKPMGQTIIIDEVSFGTGIFVKQFELAYGQIINDGMIVMEKYHPMLKLANGECRELEESDYDKVGIT